MRTVIIKVTHNCNLGCKYCCVGDASDLHPMSFDTMRNLFKHLSEEGDTSSLIWHGGEPLCVGLSYFREIVKLQSEFPNHHFRNGIQTNGTLLSDECLLFFKENAFQLGFSIDGCSESHNLNRPYKTGGASFEDTFKWFNRAKELGLHVGAICVINSNTAKYIDEIYRFAKEYDVPFKFNPQYPAGRATINVDLGLDNDQIAQAYIRLFDLWYYDDSAHRANIRMFESFVSAISRCSNGDTSLKGFDCAYCNRCQYSFVGIAPNGDVYPCGKFVGEDEFCCGNINEENFSFKNLLNHSVVKSIINRHEKGIAVCKECQYLSLCSSGCPYNAMLFSGNFMAKNPFCKANLLLFDHIKKELLRNNVSKDIFVIPSECSDNQFIIYSPLRGKAFLADKEAKVDVCKYIETGILPTNSKKLYNYLQEWNNQIVIPAKDTSSLNTNAATILLTDKCNMSCSYCYSSESRSIQSLDKSKLKSVLDYILGENRHSCKSFSFIGGGEPTVEWDLLQWSVNYIRATEKSSSSTISLTTNGTLLNKERVSWLKENKVYVVVSFDVLPMVQNSQRPISDGNESFQRVDQAIKELLDQKVFMHIRATITKDSTCLMPEMVRFVHQNYPGIQQLQFEPVLDESQNDEFFFDNFRVSFLEAIRMGSTYGLNVYNMLSLSFKTLQTTFCRGELCVCPNGDLSVCHRISSAKDLNWNNFCLGKVDKSGVVVDDDKMKHVMYYHNQQYKDCSSCFAQYHCAGGCYVFRSKLTSSLFQKYCNYSKNMLKDIILSTINKF